MHILQKIEISPKKNSKNLRKIQNFKLKNSAKSPIFNFFSFFLLQNGCNIIFFQLKISEWLYLVSLYFLLQKPQKIDFPRFFRELCENRSPDFNFDPKFGISAQKPIRTTIWRFWIIFHPENCYTENALCLGVGGGGS